MRYFVESKFYDNGKVTGRMYLESEAYGMDKTPCKELNGYDRYIDEFSTYEEAEAFLKDCEKA